MVVARSSNCPVGLVKGSTVKRHKHSSTGPVLDGFIGTVVLKVGDLCMFHVTCWILLITKC